MQNDYECPNCHNIFPSSNKLLHEARCSAQNPLPLNKSRLNDLNEIQEKTENKNQIKPPEKNEEEKNELKKKISSGEFPDIFECPICKEIIMEKDREDHMYCHSIEKEEKNKQNNMEVSPEEIAEQKEIERQIEQAKRNNEMNNQRNNQRNNNNNDPFLQNLGDSDELDIGDPNANPGMGNFMSNLRNMIFQQQNSGLNNLNNLNNPNPQRNQRNNNNNSSSHSRSNNVVINYTFGPNGERIVQTYQSNNNQPQNIFTYNNGSRRRNISFIDFNNGDFDFDDFFSGLFQRMGSYEHPTEEQILNELPETEIEDVNKLDPEKKNCIICLEDFKNGDKATFLPCIHIFHTNCIKNWLKTQNTCPICKSKLTGENLDPQV